MSLIRGSAIITTHHEAVVCVVTAEELNISKGAHVQYSRGDDAQNCPNITEFWRRHYRSSCREQHLDRGHSEDKRSIVNTNCISNVYFVSKTAAPLIPLSFPPVQLHAFCTSAQCLSCSDIQPKQAVCINHSGLLKAHLSTTHRWKMNIDRVFLKPLICLALSDLNVLGLSGFWVVNVL